MFSLQNRPKEWKEDEKISDGPRNSKDDIDYKSFALYRFFELCGQGQPGQLELLFAPGDKILFKEPEWEEILENRHLFVSQGSVKPFIGFALSQAHKAVIKGENLNTIQALITHLDKFTPEMLNKPINDHIKEFPPISCESPGYEYYIGESKIERSINDFGAPVVKIANRQYDIGQRTKMFLASLKELEGRYGTRTRASAELGVDPKFLMHAYRQLNQATELLETGIITLPRPAEELELYRKIRASEYEGDYFAELTSKIDHIRQVIQPKSTLPKEPNWKQINKLCQMMLRRHLL
jgi:hypothetical protein